MSDAGVDFMIHRRAKLSICKKKKTFIHYVDPKDVKKKHLNDSEKVDLLERHVSQVVVVWLVLGWHEEEANPVDELHSPQ